VNIVGESGGLFPIENFIVGINLTAEKQRIYMEVWKVLMESV